MLLQYVLVEEENIYTLCSYRNNLMWKASEPLSYSVRYRHKCDNFWKQLTS